MYENVRARAPGLIVAGLPAGTRVELEDGGGSRLREVGTQTSYFGQSSPWLHVGLGAGPVRGLRFRTPSGLERELERLPPEARLEVAADGTLAPAR